MSCFESHRLIGAQVVCVNGSMSLPEGWETAVSRSSGDTYYHNPITGESQFEFPTSDAALLPPMDDDVPPDVVPIGKRYTP